ALLRRRIRRAPQRGSLPGRGLQSRARHGHCRSERGAARQSRAQGHHEGCQRAEQGTPERRHGARMTDVLPARPDLASPEERADRLLTVQAPQRPLSSPTFTVTIDGREVTGRVGQTILEVCRDHGIEVPTLCYEPKLPGFGACRMCVVDVEGEEHPPISCSRLAEDGMVVQTQTEEIRRLRRTNLELIFSDHNAYCLPPCHNKCPSHIDI